MINILTEKPQENCLLLPFLIDTLKKDHVRRYQEGNHLQTRKRALLGTKLAHILILDFSDSRTVRKLIYVF